MPRIAEGDGDLAVNTNENPVLDDLENIEKDLIEAAARAYRRGIQTGNGGNLSARIPGKDLMVVKPSGVSFIDCNEDNLVVTDFDGKVVAGSGKASREALLHGVLYRNVPSIGGIVHCHAPWAISWSFSKKDLPLVTHHARMKFGVPVATLDIDAPVVPPEAMPKVVSLFEKHPTLPAFLLVGHGIVAVGKNVLGAEHVAELVEETAQIAWLRELGKKVFEP
jgi:L-ribulose-5-phosphate 4-epimerase